MGSQASYDDFFVILRVSTQIFTFVFLCFAFGRSLFLFQGLGLAMLSPPAQLEVDKFPHHKGLCEADGG